ncbi:recombination hotspot-binding protein [Histoplasma capsulatum H143]|uniref:Recombination hotspot-binding protein n=1 Tax=Ajellomyces capsulatus (strain H143) TaxID=544712 RepID=C6H5S2_AJECH|nr:recombination hotspot-binding protein [Histoplasma capsulatum H143]
MIDPSIFQSLQAKIDEESHIRDELQDIVQTLSKRGSCFDPRGVEDRRIMYHGPPNGYAHVSWYTYTYIYLTDLALRFWSPIHDNIGRSTQAILSRAHSTPADQLTPVLDEAATEIRAQKEDVARLVSVAAQHPFYKYNHIWSRELQNLAGLRDARAEKANGFMTIEEVGEFLGGMFRLAVNSVTLGDYARPLQISKFVSDLQAGFQLLNLKNDSLRKRSDGIKYSVKKVEDVVYDLSLRNLISRNPPAGGGGGDMEE